MQCQKLFKIVVATMFLISSHIIAAGRGYISSTVLVKATAYCPCALCCGKHADNRTATGRNALLPGVAVDSKIIPLGSRVDIPGYDRGLNKNGSWILADDVGSAINGYRIDVRFKTHQKAVAWGVRYIKVRIWKKTKIKIRKLIWLDEVSKGEKRDKRPMEIIRGYKVELDVNNKQRTLLMRCAGVARWAYNWGLERRIREYEETGQSSNAIEQHRQLNALKKAEHPWLYNYSKAISQEALRDLDKAFQNFFRRVQRSEKPGFPKFKSRKRGVGSFRLTGAIRVEEKRIRLPRIGWLRLKERGYIPTDAHILSAIVSESAGRWFVSVQVREEIEVTQATGELVGVDLGVKDTAVTSDGRRFENPNSSWKQEPSIGLCVRFE